MAGIGWASAAAHVKVTRRLTGTLPGRQRQRPDDPKAAQVKGSLPALQQMIKK